MGFHLQKGSCSGLEPPVSPGGACSLPLLPEWSGAAQELRAEQGRAGGAGWEPDLPGERRTASPTCVAAAAAAAGACVAVRPGPRAGAERPPLPHASRTNKTLRSGLCEGLVAGRERRARGLAVALGDLLVLFFRERSATQRSASRHPHLCASAADTSATEGAHLVRPSPPGRPPPTGSFLAGSSAHVPELVREPGL